MMENWDISVSVGDTSHVDSCELMGMQYKLFLLALLMGTKLVPTQGRVIAKNPDVGWLDTDAKPQQTPFVSFFVAQTSYPRFLITMPIRCCFIMKLSPVSFSWVCPKMGYTLNWSSCSLWQKTILVLYIPLLDRPKSSHSHYSLIKFWLLMVEHLHSMVRNHNQNGWLNLPYEAVASSFTLDL